MGRAPGFKWTEQQRERVLAARAVRPLEDRFYKFVTPRGRDECWPWEGGHNGVNYGMMRVHKRSRLATHVSLELDGRPRPSAELHCLHSCDNPICVNPAHLRWGTRSENIQEAVERGQLKSGCSRGHGWEYQYYEGAERKRRCRICQTERNKRRQARLKAARE